MQISAVINTFNEEDNIAECINSIRNFVDEILVCDMYSTDKTVEIAQRLGARVVKIKADFCDFGRLRLAAVNEACGTWVLVIDADERLTANLAEKLKQVVIEDKYELVYLSNLYWYFGGWVYHGGFFNNNWPRFFQRRVYLERFKDYNELIHNDLSALQGVENALVLPKSYYLKHYAYPTIEKYINKTLGRYASLEAKQYYHNGIHFSTFRLLGAPVKTFIKTFILNKGFLDGRRGFILSVLFATYRFIIWANIWFLEQQSTEYGEIKEKEK